MPQRWVQLQRKQHDTNQGDQPQDNGGLLDEGERVGGGPGLGGPQAQSATLHRAAVGPVKLDVFNHYITSALDVSTHQTTSQMPGLWFTNDQFSEIQTLLKMAL